MIRNTSQHIIHCNPLILFPNSLNLNSLISTIAATMPIMFFKVFFGKTKFRLDVIDSIIKHLLVIHIKVMKRTLKNITAKISIHSHTFKTHRMHQPIHCSIIFFLQIVLILYFRNRVRIIWRYNFLSTYHTSIFWILIQKSLNNQPGIIS